MTDLLVLHVEVPSFSHSFVIHVPLSSTVTDLKQYIFKACIGAPRPDGQRLICKGRCLLDHELVQNIWKLKSPDELPVVHLAVHPSAWTSNPPALPQPSYPASSSVPLLHPLLDQSLLSPPLPSPPPPPIPLDLFSTSYLSHKHRGALWALRQNKMLLQTIPPDFDHSRAMCMLAIANQNWIWPSILDKDYPQSTPGGAIYDAVLINGKPYLQCRDVSAVPTPFQLHALKVLTYTFAIGPLPLMSQIIISHLVPSHPVAIPIPPHVNAIIQQLGFQPIRLVTNPNPNVLINSNPLGNAHNRQPQPNNLNNDNVQQNNLAGVVPEIREIPFRPLFAPLAMLAIRTLLLLYFVASARKPVLSILIAGWVIYEGWHPVRALLRRNWGAWARRPEHQMQQVQQLQLQQLRQHVNGAPGGMPAGPLPPLAPQPGRPAVPGQGQPGVVGPGPAGVQPNLLVGQGNTLVDGLANVNFVQEEAALAGAAIEEPGMLRKVSTFFVLLIVTMHPAVWDRRRKALNQREGRVRAEANVRASGDEGGGGDERRAQVAAELGARHERRAEWVKRYIFRVRAEDGHPEE